jgi:hypothetical protein
LNIDVAAKNLCLLFTDHSDDVSPVPQCLMLSLDALAKISSSPTKESLEASVPMLKLMACEKPSSSPSPPPGAAGEGAAAGAEDAPSRFVIRASPSATHVQYTSLTVVYRLDMRKDTPPHIVCPEVPEADLTRLHASGTESASTRHRKKKNAPRANAADDQSSRVDYWRWDAPPAAGPGERAGPAPEGSAMPPESKGDERVMMLVRDIQCLASPIVVNISESESRILVQWVKHSIQALSPQTMGGTDRVAGDRVSDIQSSMRRRRDMRAARAQMDDEKYLDLQFREFDLSGDGYLEPHEIEDIIKKILAPLNLLKNELDQKIFDILLLLDYDLDGKISMSEFRQNLAVEKSLLIKAHMSLLATEMVGSQVPDYITKGAHLDSTESRKLWGLIERELGILYSERNLGGKAPHVVQNMLIRLCGDLKLAHSVWDNVIRPNVRDAKDNPSVYVWTVTNEEEIGSHVDFGELASQFLSKPRSNLRSLETTANITELVVCSYTKILVKMSAIAVNVVDNFLGPTVPRFQLEMSGLSVTGEALNEGIRPHWSSVSKDAVGVVCSLGVQSSFFNSIVQEHEPIVEPWTVTCVVRKEESNGFLDCLVNGDVLNVSLSTSCLQTMASTVMNIMSAAADKRSMTGDPSMYSLAGQDNMDEAQLSKISKFESVQTMRDHYCLVKNLAGCALGLRVSAPHAPNGGSEIFVKKNSAKYITIPLLNASKRANRVKGSSFAHLFVTTYLDDPLVTFVQSSPVPLHFLVLNSIAICSSGREMFKKTCPALVLDMEPGGDGGDELRNVYNNSTLIARSNVKLRNFTDHALWVRLQVRDAAQHSGRCEAPPLLDTLVARGEVFYLPLRCVAYIDSLQLSLKKADATATPEYQKWSNLVNVASLLLHEKKPKLKEEESSPYFYSAHSFHMLNTMAVSGSNQVLYDHMIDVMSGIRVINALPYCIALRTKSWTTMDSFNGDEQGDTSAANRVYIIRPGDKFWLPVVNNKLVRVRLNIFSEGRSGSGPRPGPKQWSEALDLHALDSGLQSQHSLTLPCAAGMNCVRCNVLLTEDLASIDSNTDVPTCQTMYVYSDIWVQNNSSIPLRYKFGRSATERSVVSVEASRLVLENYCGSGEGGVAGVGPGGDLFQRQRSADPGDSDSPPLLGPVMAPTGTKNLCVQEWKDGQQRDFSPALVEFKNLVHVLPKKGANISWSDDLTLANGHTGEIRAGSIWLGYMVRQGSGIFKKTTIVTITPRYVVQNKTNVPLRIYTTMLSRVSFTTKGKMLQTDRIWEEAEAARKEHSVFLLGEAPAVAAAGKDKCDGPPPLDLNWSPDQPDQTPQPSNADYEDMIFAEAVLEKRKKRKSSILYHGSGATRGLSHERMEETRLLRPPLTGAEGEEEGGGGAGGGHSSSHAGEYAALQPSHSAVMYSFGEEASIRKLSTQAMCVSVGNSDVDSKNYVLLKLISANNVAVANSNGYSDPFCNIYWQGEHLFRSHEQRNTTNPAWGESFILALPKDDLSSLELRIEVIDYNLSRQNAFLGQVTLRSKDLLFSRGEERSYDLQKMSCGEVRGAVRVRGSLVFSVMPVSRRDVNPWTPPLRLDVPGVEYISARQTDGHSKLLNVSVMTSGCVLIVTVCEHTKEALPAFRIENRTPDLRVRFRQHQTDKIDYVRRTLRPAEGCYYGWDDPNLPRAVELVVVDNNDVESQAVAYKIDSVDEFIPPISTQGLATRSVSLRVNIHIRGHIRVLTVSAAQPDDQDEDADNDDSLGLFASWILHASIDLSFRGVSLCAVDDTPSELCNLVVEGVRVTSLADSPLWTASVMHLQLDNMMEKSKYPVMICPLDSGLNSERNPYFFQMGGGAIPLLELKFEPDCYAPVLTDATIIRALEVRVRPLNVVVDLNFIVRLVKAMVTRRITASLMLLWGLLVPGHSTCDDMHDFLLNATPCPKHEHAYSTVFIKSMILHSMTFNILLSIKMDKIEMDQNRDLQALTEHSRMIRYLAELSKSVTAINPNFEFFGVKTHNVFDRLDAICWRIAFVYISQAILQSYKIFGSMDAIGDPVGVVKGLSSSLKSFLIHSGLELSGQTPFRAEGLKHLAQGVIGSPVGSLGKVSRGVGQFLGSLSNLEVDLGQESAPAHVGEGVVQAGRVFAESLQHGVVNVVRNPYEGFKEGSVSHTVRGVAQGVLGLVLAPAIGTFGAVTKLTQSIDSTTHVFDKQLRGRMRPNRPLFYNPILHTLHNTVFYKTFTFSIDRVAMPILSAFPNHFICILVKYGRKRFASSIMPCNSSLLWSGSDATFSFPAKAYDDAFRHKMLVFKVKLLESATGHLGCALTLARGEMHPLEMSEHLVKVDQHADDYDFDSASVASSSLASHADDRSTISRAFSDRAPTEGRVVAAGPSRVSALNYNMFMLKRAMTKHSSSKHHVVPHDTGHARGSDAGSVGGWGGGRSVPDAPMPEVRPSSPHPMDFRKRGNSYASPTSSMSVSEVSNMTTTDSHLHDMQAEAHSVRLADSRQAEANLSRSGSGPRTTSSLRLSKGFKLSDLMRPGSGVTNDSLPPRYVSEAERGYEVELSVSGDVVNELLERNRYLDRAYGGEDGEPHYVCTVHLTGSYTSAISSSVKYADPSTSSKISGLPEERDVFVPAEGGAVKGESGGTPGKNSPGKK